MKRRTLIQATAIATAATVLPRIALGGSRIPCQGLLRLFNARDTEGDLFLTEGIDLTPFSIDITHDFNPRCVVGRLQDLTLKTVAMPPPYFEGHAHLYVTALIDENFLKANSKPLYWALGCIASDDNHPSVNRGAQHAGERNWANLCKITAAVTTYPVDPETQGLVHRT